MTNVAPRNILVIKLGALGDFIQSLGAMAAIRNAHASDRITLLTTSPYESLARASGYFNDVWIDQRPKWHDLSGWKELRARLNGGSFTRVYDLQNNDRTGFYLRLFSPRPEWSGAACGASHRNNSPERTKGTAFEGHRHTLAIAGIHDVKVDRLGWMEPSNNFDLQDPYVLLVPGSAPSRPEKRWPASSYAQLCNILSRHGHRPVLIGSAGEKDVLDAIAASCPEAINLCGKTTLSDLPALARKAVAAVGNDTGPMHLIAPTGCKSLVLFSGHSNPKRHAPLGQNVITMQKNSLADLRVEEVWKVFELQQTPV